MQAGRNEALHGWNAVHHREVQAQHQKLPLLLLAL